MYDFVRFCTILIGFTCKIPANRKNMITTRLYLDVRALKKDGTAPLKISIAKNGMTALYNTGICIDPTIWSKEAQNVTGKNNVKLRNLINIEKSKIDEMILQMEVEGRFAGLTATEIKDALKNINDPFTESNLFIPYYIICIEKKKTANTKRIYIQTLDAIKSFDKKWANLQFEDISKRWLANFEDYLSKRGLSVNTISIHMRNICSVFNAAVDDELTTHYPFRKYKIKHEATVKRSLSIEKLRELFNYPVEPFLQKYLDTFKLTFFLIGINPVDLCSIKNIEDGRIIYKRAKTGRWYSVKVEPEAQEILDKYKGKDSLFGLAEDKKDYFSFLTLLDRNLKRIGPVTLLLNPNKHKHKTAKTYLKKRETAFKGLSIYWARHTWASIAAKIDIPRDTISAALGHGTGNPTTSIYIDFDIKKVDEANRKVIDYVLYGKL